MEKAKVLCNCGKQVSFIEEFMFNPKMQEDEFEMMRQQGYTVIVGEDLEPSEFCLEPCKGEINCAFSKHFSTEQGFHNVYSYEKKKCDP